MATVQPGPDWGLLQAQTQDLVQQDYHGYPTVQRDLQGLLAAAQTARARTSRQRTLQDQAAASRLLANQGFDASRLQGQVSGLDLEPAVEDVFGADHSSSVDEYLSQVRNSTILAAIQNAQQDALSSFSRYMDESMARDWAADKARLLSALSPSSGVTGAGTIGGLSFGILPAALDTVGLPGAKLGARDAAYLAALKKISAAATLSEQPVGATAELAAACEGAAAAGAAADGGAVNGLWQLLKGVLSIAAQQGIKPDHGLYVDALVKGARETLEAGFASHMRTIISHHRAAAQRGGDPSPLRDVQCYTALKLRDRGALDFQSAGGQDTSWVQVYVALRAGMKDVAMEAADRVGEAGIGGTRPSLRSQLQLWLNNPRQARVVHGATAAREAARYLANLTAKSAAQVPLRQPYAAAIYCLLAGDAPRLDALIRAAPGLSATLEDYLWLKLSALAPAGSATSTAGGSPGGPGATLSPVAGTPPAPYRLPDLQADLNRWGTAYYSQNGKEPLLAATVLLYSLQFKGAVAFLSSDSSTTSYRGDAVALAAALLLDKVFDAGTDDGTPGAASLDLSALFNNWGRQFVRSDSAAALQYYMLAADAAGGDMAAKGRLFRELLVESKDYGTLLGAGGALGTGGAVATFVRTPDERRRLLELVAYECQVHGQPDEARELFMAAQRPGLALSVINIQLSRAISESKGALTPTLSTLMARGEAACEAVIAAPDERSRRDAELFRQLCIVRELLGAATAGDAQHVVQLVSKLPFIPEDRARVSLCTQEVQRLADCLKERLPDVVVAYADSLVAVRHTANVAMLQLLANRVAALKVFALDFDPSTMSDVFNHVNRCVRAYES